ncbi:MAG: hypothetical protein K2X47_10845, partial [Bdellovibrionales bacterium]|nr:hypothetical protein [Bdellovibrionales bacterium]
MKAWTRSLVVLALLGLGTFPVYQACQVQLGASTAGNPSGTGKGGLPDGLESFLGGQLKIQVDNTIPNLLAMPTYRSDLQWMIVNGRLLNPSASSSSATVRAFLIPRGGMDLEVDNHGAANVRLNSDGTFTANLTVTRRLISGMKYRLGFSDASTNKIRQSSTSEFQYGPGD